MKVSEERMWLDMSDRRKSLQIVFWAHFHSVCQWRKKKKLVSATGATENIQ